jgi:hypothetical protein
MCSLWHNLHNLVEGGQYLVEEVDVEETRLKHHHNFFQKINLITCVFCQLDIWVQMVICLEVLDTATYMLIPDCLI